MQFSFYVVVENPIELQKEINTTLTTGGRRHAG